MTNSTPSPGAGDATVAEEKKYDESKPSARLLLISGLFFVGRDTDLLGIEALRTSTVAMLYAAALSTALLATLMFLWRESRKAPTPSEPTPVSDPFWDQPRQFTDPWYQVPALFCVTVLGCQFAPRSDRRTARNGSGRVVPGFPGGHYGRHGARSESTVRTPRKTSRGTARRSRANWNRISRPLFMIPGSRFSQRPYTSCTSPEAAWNSSRKSLSP